MFERLPAVGSTDLWLVDLDAPLRVDASCLCADEQSRAARFTFDLHRQRYLQAHIALRMLLAEIVAVPPEALVFAAGVSGKPYLPGHPACRFNLSHSGHHGLVAVSLMDEIGVDIECIRPIDDRAAMARLHFDDAEVAAVAVADEVAGNTAFLLGWTRKEACLKAVGTGLDRNLRQVATGCAQSPRTVALDIDGTLVPVVVASFAREGQFVASVAHVTHVALSGHARGGRSLSNRCKAGINSGGVAPTSL